MTTKPNFTGARLVRQVEQAEFEYREYGTPRIRFNARYEICQVMADYEKPDRANFYSRSWKHNRKTQYKRT